MLLRESSRQEEQDINLSVVTGEDVETSISFAPELIELTSAVCLGDAAEIARVRSHCIECMGAQKTCDAIMVVAGFSGITKIANGTGLHLDPATEKQTVEMRQETGIDAYSEATKAQRFDA